MIPRTQRNFSLSKSDLQFSSYWHYGFNERNTRGKLFSGQFLTFVVMFTLKRSTIPYCRFFGQQKQLKAGLANIYVLYSLYPYHQ